MVVYSRFVERLAAVRPAVFGLFRAVLPVGKRVENDGRNRPTGAKSLVLRLLDEIQMSAAFEERRRSESREKPRTTCHANTNVARPLKRCVTLENLATKS